MPTWDGIGRRAGDGNFLAGKRERRGGEKRGKKRKNGTHPRSHTCPIPVVEHATLAVVEE